MERSSLPAGLGYAYTCCSVPGMGGCEVQETDWAEGAGGTWSTYRITTLHVSKEKLYVALS